jgi:uncharacterized BrkB/YihY/UPF0761 family membrane protein
MKDSANSLTTSFLKVSLSTFADYKLRHINVHAASISFYTFFSVFPLLAFLAYLVGQVSGTQDASSSAQLITGLVREILPGSQRWIEQALAQVVRANSVSNWINGALLAWAGFSLFTAIEAVLEHLPQHRDVGHRNHVSRALLTALTFVICTTWAVCAITCELMARTGRISSVFQGLPSPLATILLWGASSGSLTAAVSILAVGTLYKTLIPFSIRARYAYGSATLFTVLLFMSETLFRLYLSHQQATFQSTYGAFSTLVVLALWVHFLVNCKIFCALFSYHWELHKRGRVERSGTERSHTQAA